MQVYLYNKQTFSDKNNIRYMYIQSQTNHIKGLAFSVSTFAMFFQSV